MDNNKILSADADVAGDITQDEAWGGEEDDNWDEFGEFDKELGDDLDEYEAEEFNSATFDGLEDFDKLSSLTGADLINDAIKGLLDFEEGLEGFDVDGDMAAVQAKRDAKAAEKAAASAAKPAQATSNAKPQTGQATPKPAQTAQQSATRQTSSSNTATRPPQTKQQPTKQTLKDAFAAFSKK